MKNVNPYLPPEADLADERNANDHAVSDATRGQRLGAAMLDGVINFILIGPIMYAFGVFKYSAQGQKPPFLLMLGMAAIGFAVFALVHGRFLKRDGQTLGKKIVGIKIIGLNNAPLELSMILFKRYLPISIITLIPVVGNFLPMIDALFVYRSDRRCIHDLIAGTKVIQARKRI